MLDNPKLMGSLLDTIFKVYGWRASSVRKSIEELVEVVRQDERKKFARFFHQLLLENQHLSVGELLEKVKRGEHESCNRKDVGR